MQTLREVLTVDWLEARAIASRWSVVDATAPSANAVSRERPNRSRATAYLHRSLEG